MNAYELRCEAERLIAEDRVPEDLLREIVSNFGDKPCCGECLAPSSWPVPKCWRCAGFTSPENAARKFVRAELWSGTYSTIEIAPGIFWFDCSGHGGLVAVLSAADLPLAGAALAEKYAKTRRWRETDFWVGEEDCDWSLLAVVSPAVREGLQALHGGPSMSVEDLLRQARETALTYHAEFLIDWDAIEEAAGAAVPEGSTA